VRRNAFFFAEGCRRRPFSRRSESASRGRSAAQAERRQVGSKDRIGHSGRRGHGPATGGVRANRVGAKLSGRASAARGAGDRQARAERSTFQPLTRDNSASSLRKGLMNRLPRPRSLRKQGVRDRGSGLPAIRRSCLWIVSVAEVDERRVASCARERRARESGGV
jgi:hypothetical protein